MEDDEVQNREQSPAKKPKIDGSQPGEVNSAENTTMGEQHRKKRGVTLEFQNDENVIFWFDMTDIISESIKAKEERVKVEAAAREKSRAFALDFCSPTERNPNQVCVICRKKGPDHTFLNCPLREGGTKTYCGKCSGTCKGFADHADHYYERLMLCNFCRKVGDHWPHECPTFDDSDEEY